MPRTHAGSWQDVAMRIIRILGIERHCSELVVTIEVKRAASSKSNKSKIVFSL